MRSALLACLLLAASCGAPTTQSEPPLFEQSSSSDALLGMWGLSGECGMVDLTLRAGGRAELFDSIDNIPYSYAGTWSGDTSRVSLSMVHQAGAIGAPEGSAATYELTINGPVGASFTGSLIGPNDYGPRSVNAVRCSEEDYY